jgi:hypothetical protein
LKRIARQIKRLQEKAKEKKKTIKQQKGSKTTSEVFMGKDETGSVNESTSTSVVIQQGGGRGSPSPSKVDDKVTVGSDDSGL